MDLCLRISIFVIVFGVALWAKAAGLISGISIEIVDHLITGLHINMWIIFYFGLHRNDRASVLTYKFIIKCFGLWLR